MKQVLHNCGRLEVRQSPIEGYGVFAMDDISQGEVLEEVPFVLFPEYTKYGEKLMTFLKSEKLLHDKAEYLVNLRHNLKFKVPEKYYFKWSPPAPDLLGERIVFTVLPLGNGPIYNTSNTNNNASWHIDDQLFRFIADKNIKKGDEIRTFYGYFVAETGETYDVNNVFFHGLDRGKDSIVRLYNLRYAAPEHITAVQGNQEYLKLNEAIAKADDGLKIERIQSVEADGNIKYTFDFPTNWSIDFFYKKMDEFKRAKMPITQMTYTYKTGGNEEIITVSLPNR